MKKLRFLVPFLALFFTNCGKKADHVVPSKSPEKVLLALPAQNSLCVVGTNPSDTEATVNFGWTASANTDAYDITIKNLLTGEKVTKTFNINQASVKLKLNTPYSWQILSRSRTVAGTAVSETWKFYVSGPGRTTYAPFPALPTQPYDGQIIDATDGKLTFTWTGSDVDNDIKDYDIYLGTSVKDMALLQNHITTGYLPNVAVKTNTVYYWRIITRDKHDNLSTTEDFEFKTR